jgi:hypothetical protein
MPDIHSARIFGSGLIGMELFGSVDEKNELTAILLSNQKEHVVCYPHIVENENWYCGLVAYTYSSTCDLTITPYSADGTPFPEIYRTISTSSRLAGSAGSLGLPQDTAWLEIEGTKSLSGFELFGNVNGGLAGFVCTGMKKKAGVFPDLDSGDVTSIGFVNTEDSEAYVILTAYRDDGTVVATSSINISAHAKVVGEVQGLFDQSINEATYIAFSSDKEIMGFQLNTSTGQEEADALPIL